MRLAQSTQLRIAELLNLTISVPNQLWQCVELGINLGSHPFFR